MRKIKILAIIITLVMLFANIHQIEISNKVMASSGGSGEGTESESNTINLTYIWEQVQYYDEKLGCWVVADDTINETNSRFLHSGDTNGSSYGGNILALDSVFNGLVSTKDIMGFGSGLYRVYVCFRSPDGNVLVCDDESLLEASYEFNVNYT